MKKLRIIILVSLLLLIVPTAHAGDWEFEFFGINAKDFKGRSFSKIVVGCIASFVVHEAGHFIAGEMVGMTTSWKSGIVWAGDYDDKTDYEKSLFHGGGFLAQAAVGTALTAIPYTRHSDFSLGFNGFTTVNNIGYGVTGGTGKSGEENSDVKNLDYYGHNGSAIAIGSGVLSGVYTYINLNKDKEEK